MGTLFKILSKMAIPVAVIALIFVAVGDIFLPAPLNTYSENTREKINQTLLGVIPDPDLRRPSEGREKLFDELY